MYSNEILLMTARQAVDLKPLREHTNTYIDS